jgi:aryl-alcohol dehydrogenase-like predicted oxidoreductase
MDTRPFGRSGDKVSVLGFGCGAVGGLMVRGSPEDQERAVLRALEGGITFFDTAPLYGNGLSETNLGRVLAKLKPKIFLATKLTLAPEDFADLDAAIERSLTGSFARLGVTHVDLLQLHNRIERVEGGEGHDRPLTPEAAIERAGPALDRLKRQGRIRYSGITALGDTDCLHRVVTSGAFDSAQICFNLLNPSAAFPMPKGWPGQDYARLMTTAHKAGMATIGIRAVAGGALSGETARHPTGMAEVPPIGSGPDYATDAANARRFETLVKAGHATSLVDAALRFVTGEVTLTTAMVGTSTLEQLDAAIASAKKGKLSEAAMAQVREAWNGVI